MNTEIKPIVRTLDDIAKIAGVSKSTASRALNDNPLISEKTRLKIQKIAKDHNFIKHYGASSLSLNTSNTIALMVPKYDENHYDLVRVKEDPFFNKVLAGILSQTDLIGKELLISSFDPASPVKIAQLVNSRKVDGAIVFGATDENEKFSDHIPANFPIVFWGNMRTTTKYKTVSGNDMEGARLATQALIDAGKKNIAYIGGFGESPEVSARFEGYKKAIHHLNSPKFISGFGRYTHQSGEQQMRQLLDLYPDIDGVFAGSDVLAMAAISVLKQKGKSIPENVAVVGYDDIDMAEFFKPALTTISQNGFVAGQILVDKLISIIKKEPDSIEQRTYIDVHLIRRESCQ
ncbi:LacI family DNA-binding transcriptional regulator [Marinicellulosiphila megalodicopiae]|uniref:LacI family DNA-binding transcriptional regulator n=1 Tax=Marinicellulosiphila megalodicopiae TaxID=2724896 RepID=UPI003BB1968E